MSEYYAADTLRRMREDFSERVKGRRRFFLKSAEVEAERLPSGNWRVKGHGWLRDGVEFTEENFRANFEEL